MVNLALREYRETGYPSAQEGRRFYLTRQVPDAVVTGEIGFDETTPTVMIRNGSDNKIIIRRVIVTNLTSKIVDVSAVLDEVDRFSSGGVGETPQNTNADSSAVSGIADVLLGALEHCVEAAKHDHRQDDVAVLATDVQVPEHVVGDAPDEVGDPAELGALHFRPPVGRPRRTCSLIDGLIGCPRAGWP